MRRIHPEIKTPAEIAISVAIDALRSEIDAAHAPMDARLYVALAQLEKALELVANFMDG